MISATKFIQISAKITKNVRFVSTQPINLVGRHYVIPKDLNEQEIKSILWTAIELKCLLKNKRFKSNYTTYRKITLLMNEPCFLIQGSVMSAASIMKSYLNVIVDPTWETRSVQSIGKILSFCSDLIFCKSNYQSKLEDIAKYSSIPVVCIGSCSFSMLDSLADLMTLQEKYGHLRGLNLGWIGEPCPLMNTYLCTVLRLGINIKYYCACPTGAKMSPAMLQVGKNISEEQQTVLQECDTADNVLEEIDVIVLPEDNVAGNKQNLLKLQDIESKAHKDWCLLHALSTENERLLDHKHSLIWQAKANLQWIYAAIILRFLTDYEHCSAMPKFDSTSI